MFTAGHVPLLPAAVDASCQKLYSGHLTLSPGRHYVDSRSPSKVNDPGLTAETLILCGFYKYITKV
jgi:hypothetical protein